MPDVQIAPQGPRIPLPHQRLRLIVFIVLAVIFLTWWRSYFTNLRVNRNPTSEPSLIKATESAQPLLEALEKYHIDNNLYPATLDDLTGTYIPSIRSLQRFRYSARRADWVFKSEKSDACIAREKSLNGWILKPVKEHQQEVAQFKLDCISGYHNYQLQSADFPQDPQAQYIERWAYYDSQTKQWSLGWCNHETGVKRSGSMEIATNGICRWRGDRKSEPW